MLVDTILKRRRYQLLLTPFLMDFLIYSEFRDYIYNDTLLITKPGLPFDLFTLGSGVHDVDLIFKPGLPFELFTIGSGEHDVDLINLPANPILISSLFDSICHNVGVDNPTVYPIELWSDVQHGKHRAPLLNNNSGGAMDMLTSAGNMASLLSVAALPSGSIKYVDIFADAVFKNEFLITMISRTSVNTELVSKIALTFLQNLQALGHGRRAVTSVSANMFLQTPFLNETLLRYSIASARTTAPTHFTVLYNQRIDVIAVGHIREKYFPIYTQLISDYDSFVDVINKTKYNFIIYTSPLSDMGGGADLILLPPIRIEPFSLYTVPIESDIIISPLPVSAADMITITGYVEHENELDTFSLPRLIGDTMWIDQACEIIIDEEDLYII